MEASTIETHAEPTPPASPEFMRPQTAPVLDRERAAELETAARRLIAARQPWHQLGLQQRLAVSQLGFSASSWDARIFADGPSGVSSPRGELPGSTTGETTPLGERNSSNGSLNSSTTSQRSGGGRSITSSTTSASTNRGGARGSSTSGRRPPSRSTRGNTDGAKPTYAPKNPFATPKLTGAPLTNPRAAMRDATAGSTYVDSGRVTSAAPKVAAAPRANRPKRPGGAGRSRAAPVLSAAMQAAAAGGSTGAITRGASESTLHTLRAPPGPPLPRVLPEVPAVAAWQSPGGHSDQVLRAAQRHFTPIQRR